MEETGVSDVGVPEHVGTRRWDPRDGPRHRRHFLHAEAREERDRWTHVVSDGDADEGLVFECYWVPLAEATLDHEMDACLDVLS